MPRFAVALAVVFAGMFLPGCTHNQLKWNATHQAATLSRIYEQQVLDNVAKFVHDINATPSFAYPNQGSAQVVDGGGVGGITGWNAAGFTSQTLNVSGSRNMTEGWTLTPTFDPRRLELMRCAYQISVSGAGYGHASTSCPDCEKAFRAFYTGSPKRSYGGDTEPDGNTLAYYSRATGRTTPACFNAVRWFACGDKKSLPKNRDCMKVGHYCGTYIWMLPCGQDELTKLTLVILDYAFTTPPPPPSTLLKSVTRFYNANGELLDDAEKAAVKVEMVMPADSVVSRKNLNDPETLAPPKPLSIPQRLDIRNFRNKFPGMRLSPKDLGEMNSFKDLTEEQRQAIADTENAADSRDDTPPLPPFQPPPTGNFYSPLQFQMYQNTLAPSPFVPQ